MIFDAFSAQGKIFPLNEIRYFFGRNHDFEASLHMPVIKTSEIIIYPKLLKNHQKMNVSPSVDAIWGGTGAGCTEHRKMDCRLNIFLYIVQFMLMQRALAPCDLGHFDWCVRAELGLG